MRYTRTVLYVLGLFIRFLPVCLFMFRVVFLVTLQGQTRGTTQVTSNGRVYQGVLYCGATDTSGHVVTGNCAQGCGDTHTSPTIFTSSRLNVMLGSLLTGT